MHIARFSVSRVSLGAMAAAAAVVMGVGCMGDDPITVEAYCAQRSARECEVVAPMCLAVRATCETSRTTLCLQTLPDRTKRPFQPDAVGACLEKTSEVYRKPTITPQDRQMLAGVCERVFSGTLNIGEPCVSDFDCRSPYFCHNRGTDARVCAPRTVVMPDAFCNNPGDICPAGQYCAGPTGTRRCVARRAENQPCDAENLCSETLRCNLVGTDDNAATAAAMVCVSRRGPGESCATDDDCAPATPYCNPFYNNTCDVGFTPSRGNAECVAFGGMASTATTAGDTSNGIAATASSAGR